MASKKWSLYEAGDRLGRKNKSCPKCGAGVFLAGHKDRFSCGKCGYTEFRKKEEKPPEKPVEGAKKPKEEKRKK
jgi:small subunit ribosomal protein S27Ae